MTRIKRISILAAALALGALGMAALPGCGEDVAATWSHGKILEEDVTSAAESDLSAFLNDDYTTYDVEGWSAYIANREYDVDVEDADTDTDDATATDAATETDADDADEDTELGDGTVAEYREYLIKQLVRNDVQEYEVDQANIEVTQDEVDARVDEEAAMYEAYYGGGYSGTFESILENYMGIDMETFESYVQDELELEKFEMQVCDVDDADDIDEDEYEAYLDEKVEEADIVINDCPSDLSYDPAVLEANQADEATETDADESEDTDTDTDADATSTSTSAATTTESDATTDEETASSSSSTSNN